VSGWKNDTLGNVFETITGATPAKSHLEFYGDFLPLVKPPELNDDIVLDANDGLSELGAKQARVAPKGSILVSCIGNLGKVGLAGRSVAVNQQINCILPRLECALPKFMFYQALSPRFRNQLAEKATGTTISIVNKTKFNEISVSLPPLAEQKRIVAILNEAFEGIAKATANAERNLANAREVLPTLLDRLLSNTEGAQIVDLEQVVDDDCSLSYGIVQPGDEVESGLPIVRPTDLGAREIGLEGLKRINPSLAAGYQRTTLKGRDLLLCVRGTTGVVSQASSELSGANVTRGIVPIRFREDVLHQDLGYFVLLSQGVQQQIRAATYGAALMQINIRDVRKIRVSVPPVHRQSDLLGQLDGIASDADRLEANYVRQLELLSELKSSILYKAFSGQLAGKEAIAA